MNSNEIKNLEDALAIIQALQSENEKLKQQNANLTELIVKSQKKMFGKSSESMGNIEGAEQLTLFNEAEQEYSAAAPEPAKETLVASHTRKAKHTKEELTDKLEHREMICDLEDKHCKECGEEFVCIGKEFVRSELSIIPAQVFVVDIYRKVYKCAKCEEKNLAADIIKAESPVPVMKKSMATPATVAYVMQQKYQLGVSPERH